MKTLSINSPALFRILGLNLYLALGMFLSWFILPFLIRYLSPTAGLLDSGIIQLVLLGTTCYLVTVLLAWLLLSQLLKLAGLPPLNNTVSQFKTLTTWQQLGFYWASFALLLLAGILCLGVII